LLASSAFPARSPACGGAAGSATDSRDRTAPIFAATLQAVGLLEARPSAVLTLSMARVWRAAGGGRRPLTGSKPRNKEASQRSTAPPAKRLALLEKCGSCARQGRQCLCGRRRPRYPCFIGGRRVQESPAAWALAVARVSVISNQAIFQAALQARSLTALLPPPQPIEDKPLAS